MPSVRLNKKKVFLDYVITHQTKGHIKIDCKVHVIKEITNKQNSFTYLFHFLPYGAYGNMLLTFFKIKKNRSLRFSF